MDNSRIKKFAQYARSKLIPQMGQMIDFWMSAEEVSGGIRVGNQIFSNTKDEHYTMARNSLVGEVTKYGKDAVAEHAAYIWFNRVIALRYMEIHGYLPIRSSLFVSNDGGQMPDIVSNAMHEYKLCGVEESIISDLQSKHNNADLYRVLFVGLCNTLADEYGFLFSKIDNWSVLLFPKDITSSNHIIKDSGNGILCISDDDWKEVEIIGWMYQYYISERKEELDKSTDKLANGDDIAASTQLFTPEWIVKYIVHNTVGKLSESKLSHKIETTHTFTYDIENIESFKVLDPAVGSGHILVRAYDTLKDIYKSKGYSISQIPQLILENNLYGFDICPRAHQLACFAVLMKAKADDVSIHTKVDVTKHLICIIENNNFMEVDDKKYPHLRSFLQLRYNASMYGSLIRIPNDIDEAKIRKEFLQFQKERNLFADGICDNQTLELLFNQTNLLDGVYDCTVANPPYKGGGKVNLSYSKFLSIYYPEEKSDLFAVFIVRCLEFCRHGGFVGMVTMQSWMFLSSYENVRKKILKHYTIDSLVHHGAHGFPEISGEIVQTVSFVIHDNHNTNAKGIYIDLRNEKSAEGKEEKLLESINHPNQINFCYKRDQHEFEKIPGSPIAYWTSVKIREIFEKGIIFSSLTDAKSGIMTGNDALFIRFWTEININKLGLNHKQYKDIDIYKKKWFSITRGGEYRKWYGNLESIVNIENNGYDIKNAGYNNRLRNGDYYFKKGITWTGIGGIRFSVRLSPEGTVFGSGGPTCFIDNSNFNYLFGLLNTKIIQYILNILNPTLNYIIDNINSIPIIFPSLENNKDRIDNLTKENINLSKKEWDSREISRDFGKSGLISNKQTTIEHSYQNFCDIWTEKFFQLHNNEEELNRQFIEIYGLQGEVTSEVPLHEITILQDELETKQLKENGAEILQSRQLPRKRDVIVKQLMSYILGCIMGRYSLDIPGLAYAGGKRDTSKYKTFLPDEDGIVPVLDDLYFEDDIVERTKAFVKKVWGEESFQENRQWIAQSLEPTSTKSAEKIIREYRYKTFVEDHHKNYCKRPIYWYFASSSKKGKPAFQAVVYLHRINDQTISRLRHEYLHKFQAKLESEYERLGSSTDRESEKRKSEITSIQAELTNYDHKLKNFADKNIVLDLDDGVKVNYGMMIKEGLVLDLTL